MATATLEYPTTKTKTTTYTTTGESMDFNLGDIPDLSSLASNSEGNAWENGWYSAEILGKREFEDKNGMTRLFESNDQLAASGESRNIRLQVKVTRASDGRVLHLSNLINYRTSDLSPEVVAAVIADSAKPEDERDRSLMRSRLTLARLAGLQKIAGVRSFQRAEDGGLILTPLFGQKCFARLKDDDKNPAFKQVADYRTADNAPKKLL